MGRGAKISAHTHKKDKKEHFDGLCKDERLSNPETNLKIGVF
jgi:hypothetical protein